MITAPLALSLGLLLQAPVAAGAAPGGDEEPAGGAFLEIELGVGGAAPVTLSYGYEGATGLRVFSFGNEGRPGVAAVIGGTGRTPGPNGQSGVGILFFIHLFEDARSFVEVQLLNDAMVEPPGRVAVTYRLSHLGELFAEGSTELLDQTGLHFSGGTPRFAPRQGLQDAYLRHLPDLKQFGAAPPVAAAPFEVPLPPQRSAAALRFLAAGDPEDAAALRALLDGVRRSSERPFHLSRPNGEPFFQRQHPEAYFVAGRPEMKPYRETFDRILMIPDQLGNLGEPGWDAERLDGEELYAAYALLGSRLARRELVLLAEELLATAMVREELRQVPSAAEFAAAARLLVRAFQASGQDRYLDGVRRMLASLESYRVTAEPFRALAPRRPPASGGDLGAEAFERTADVAAAALAIALFLEQSPGDRRALALLEFCGDLIVEQGTPKEGNGFYDAYSIESQARSGSGAALEGAAIVIPAALVAVARSLPETSREKYLAPARRAYQSVREEPWARPGTDLYWHHLATVAYLFE